MLRPQTLVRGNEIGERLRVDFLVERIHSDFPFRWFRLSEQIDWRGRNEMNFFLRRPGYQRQGVPDVPVGWPSAGVPVLSPSPVRLRRDLGRTGDQVIDSAPACLR